MEKEERKENNYTKLENRILEALAKGMANGLITARERAIIDYILLSTYHKEGGLNLRPVDIGKELGLSRQHVSKLLSALKKKKIVIKDKSGFLINIKVEDWVNVNYTVNNVNYKVNVNHKVNNVNYTVNNVNHKVNNVNDIVNNVNFPVNNVNYKVNAGDNIYNNKEYNNIHNEDNIKDISSICIEDKESVNNPVDNVNRKVNKKPNKKPNQIFKLVDTFARFREIKADKGFISKNSKHAKELLKQYPPELIMQVVKWRLENDDGFWHQRLNNLGTVYSYVAEWIGEMKRGKKIISFKDFIQQNPHLDYRQLPKGSRERELALFRALREAYKSGYVEFTPKMWEVYNSFLEEIERRKNEFRRH